MFGVNLAEEVAEGLELLDVVALDFVALGILVLEDGAEDVVFIELDWECIGKIPLISLIL